VNLSTSVHHPAASRLDMSQAFAHGSIVRVGEKQAERRLSGQDHAVARAGVRGLALAVADGASTRPGPGGTRVFTRNEVGAWLVAELAADAIASALDRGVDDPDRLRRAAAAAIVSGMRPIWAQLGPGAQVALSSTLVLAAVTPAFTIAWLSGDGCWGAIAVPERLSATPRVEGMDEADVEVHGDGLSLRGGRHSAVLPHDVASRQARLDLDAVVASLEVAMWVPGPVVAAWVATDGLLDEPAAMERLRHPVRRRDHLDALLVRPEGCDDLAVAYAAEVAHG
jgi:hypothetical protein